MSGDRYIRCVTLRLLWPLCGSEGNSALRELFLILGGGARVALGAVGSEGMEDAGVHECFVMTGGGLGVEGGVGGQVLVEAGLVAAAGIQPQARLGAYKPLHWRMNGSTDVQYEPIHANTLKDSPRKYFNSSAAMHSRVTQISWLFAVFSVVLRTQEWQEN